MTAARKVKSAGFKTVNEMAKLCGRSPVTVLNWYKKDPEFLEIVILGCMIKKHNRDGDPVEKLKIIYEIVDSMPGKE